MDIDQNTDEWLMLRCGVVTASVVKQLLTPTLKIAKNQSVVSMAYDFAAQRELMHVEKTPQTYHMMRGHLEEELARDVYSDNYAEVTKCGFVRNDTHGFILGYSPDGLVGDDGLIEIKSRIQKYQLQTIINGEVPDEYILQLQTGLLVTEREWIDFISYSNGMPLFVKRVYPDSEMQSIIIEAVEAFYDRVEVLQEEYRKNSSKLIPCERVPLDFDTDIQA